MPPNAHRFALGLTALALLVTAGALGILPKYAPNRAALLGHGDYVLDRTDGDSFIQESLKGAPSAVFYGFTRCPEICPTTMGDIATWKETLPASEGLQVFFALIS